jgi:hypothetical protein
MPLDYQDIPLPPSEFGRALYRRGRRLVEQSGLRMEEVVWDCDEVLWDWVMDASRMLSDPTKIWRWDFGHREWYMLKPGVFELIWGMHHAARQAGHDPYMRIWTNGYPWRLWRVAREIPGLVDLLGPPASLDAEGQSGFVEHPRIFSRTDFVEIAPILIGRRGGDGRVDHPQLEADDQVHRLIVDQLERDPYDSSFKLPELAALRGKGGFGAARYLIDDHPRNVERFVASGRHAIRVVSHTPRVLFGKVPNTVWSDPMATLQALDNSVAEAVADALAHLAGEPEPALKHAHPDGRPADYPTHTFTVDIPDEKLREEWIEPMQRLRQA